MSAADTLRKCVALLKQVDFADCAESEALWHQHGLVLQEAEAVLRDGEKQKPVAWASFAENGNIRIWSTNPLETFGFNTQPLYTHPAPSLQAVGAVPKGFVLVPAQPTNEMLEALTVGASKYDSWRKGYSCMLAAAPQPAAAPSGDAIRELIALHADELEQNDYAYFELARTRRTGWMAWICTNLIDNDPGRKVLATGQGSTPDEACEAAIQDYKGRVSVQCDSRG